MRYPAPKDEDEIDLHRAGFWFLFAFLASCASGFCNGLMDTVADGSHFYASCLGNLPPELFLKTESWPQKWAGGDPRNGPRFFMSDSAFVFTTDFWHFAKMLTLSFGALAGAAMFQLGRCLPHVAGSAWVHFLIFVAGGKLLFSANFSLVYTYLAPKTGPDWGHALIRALAELFLRVHALFF